MSYSTYMFIHGWKKGRDIKIKLDKACEIFNRNFDIIPNRGYWQKSESDYVTFTDFVKNKIVLERETENNESLFVFCNHDGETDVEVYQSFVEFAKILAYLNSQILIEIETEATLKKNCVHIISKGYGNLKIPIDMIKKEQNELKMEIMKYERINDIKWHESELKKLRTCDADN